MHDFIDTVRDIDDRDPLSRELAHDLEEPFAFGGRERGRGLVHNENSCRNRQGLGDLDELLFADTKAAHAGIGIKSDAQSREQVTRGLPRSLAVDNNPGDTRFTPEKDVVGDREFRNEIELLMDNCDAFRFRLPDIGEADRIAGNRNPAFITRIHPAQDLHERRLTRAIFAHQRMNFACAQIEMHISQCRDAAEALANTGRYQQRAAWMEVRSNRSWIGGSGV